MLQSFKNKSFKERISEIKLSKAIFSCLLVIASIFAGICCQINQTEQNATYIKEYLANKNGYYQNLVSKTRTKVLEKYYNHQTRTEDFSGAFRTDFLTNLSNNPDFNPKDGIVIMQLKSFNDFFSEILEENINLEDSKKQLNLLIDFRFSDQSKITNAKKLILNNFAAKTDRLLSKERISVDPTILATFISPMVNIYYNQLLLISHANSYHDQFASNFRLFMINIPILIFLVFLVIGYFFYTKVAGRLIIFCIALLLFFFAFLMQLPTSNHNIDLIYNQKLFTDYS